VNENPQEILIQRFSHLGEARILSGAPSGFSGARVWQARISDQTFALRRWPASAGPAGRLDDILHFQSAIAADGLPAPRPMRALDGSFAVTVQGSLWGLSSWMPGVADYWKAPSVQKLEAALAMLAKIHAAASQVKQGFAGQFPRLAKSPALIHRAELLEGLLSNGVSALTEAVKDRRTDASLAREVIELLEQTAPPLLGASQRWAQVKLPLQWRLTDVWHDHILFTGDDVSGVIDFDAAAIDTPAGDIARLLGSLAGDDPRSWQLGIAAYERVRPLSAVERTVVPLLDASGTVLSAANWVRWLFCPSEAGPTTLDRGRAITRLQQLCNRLLALADARGKRTFPYGQP
jgi:Ser/Thr protein kinase RdoA (MazF antagonist)